MDGLETSSLSDPNGQLALVRVVSRYGRGHAASSATDCALSPETLDTCIDIWLGSGSCT